MTQKQIQQDMDWESHYVALMQASDSKSEKTEVLLELVSFLGYERVVQAFSDDTNGAC